MGLRLGRLRRVGRKSERSRWWTGNWLSKRLIMSVLYLGWRMLELIRVVRSSKIDLCFEVIGWVCGLGFRVGMLGFCWVYLIK